jgi:hypothetical protein
MTIESWGREINREIGAGRELGRGSTIETNWFVSMVLFTTVFPPSRLAAPTTHYDRFMSGVVSKRLAPSV